MSRLEGGSTGAVIGFGGYMYAVVLACESVSRSTLHYTSKHLAFEAFEVLAWFLARWEAVGRCESSRGRALLPFCRPGGVCAFSRAAAREASRCGGASSAASLASSSAISLPVIPSCPGEDHSKKMALLLEDQLVLLVST